MAFIKYSNLMIGDKIILDRKVDSLIGYFEKGTEVTITGIDPVRGYCIADSEGNTIGDCGWSIGHKKGEN